MAKYWYPSLREINAYMTSPNGTRHLFESGIYWRPGFYLYIWQKTHGVLIDTQHILGTRPLLEVLQYLVLHGHGDITK